MMQIHVPLLVIAAILVASIESKPIWPEIYLGNYPSEAIGVQQSQLLHYQEHSPYYVYNVRPDTVPAAVIANGKPTISQIPAYGLYYQYPFFDFRYPVVPLDPTAKPVQPAEPPKPAEESRPTVPTTTPAEPTEGKDGGIEKLDNKVEPERDGKKSSETSNNDDDTVVIESL
nr:uncharacterized protein LOC117221713 [Megalopta genalis]